MVADGEDLAVRGEAQYGAWLCGAVLGAPRSLRELGMAEDEIPRTADLAVSNPDANPRPVSRDAIEALLWIAWTGAPSPRTAPAHRATRTERRSRA